MTMWKTEPRNLLEFLVKWQLINIVSKIESPATFYISAHYLTSYIRLTRYRVGYNFILLNKFRNDLSVLLIITKGKT